MELRHLRVVPGRTSRRTAIKEEEMMQGRWRGGTPASKPCEAGLTIGKRIPALSNDWALTIALCKNFSVLVSAHSNKCHGLETPERPGVKFIGARPVVNKLTLTILISISTLCLLHNAEYNAVNSYQRGFSFS